MVADAVEDERTPDILRAFEVHTAQGYVFEMPVAVATSPDRAPFVETSTFDARPEFVERRRVPR